MWTRLHFSAHWGWLGVLAVMVLFANTFAHASANVTLQSFTPTLGTGKVTVNWVTASEINNAGFNVLRSETASGTFAKINTTLIPGCAGCITGAPYKFDDANITAGKTYYYKLEMLAVGGGTQNSEVKSVLVPAPASTPTPTKTTVPATAIRTNTLVPPTATNTVPPGFPTLTPSPSPQKVAAAPTVGRNAAGKTFTPAPASPTPVVTATIPRIALAPADSTPGAPAEEDDLSEENLAPPETGTASVRTIIGVGILLGSGMIGVLALVFRAGAVLLFIRAKRRA